MPEQPPVQETVMAAASCTSFTVLATLACAASPSGQQPVAHSFWPAGQRQRSGAKHVNGGWQHVFPHTTVPASHCWQ